MGGDGGWHGLRSYPRGKKRKLMLGPGRRALVDGVGRRILDGPDENDFEKQRASCVSVYEMLVLGVWDLHGPDIFQGLVECCPFAPFVPCTMYRCWTRNNTACGRPSETRRESHASLTALTGSRAGRAGGQSGGCLTRRGLRQQQHADAHEI